MEGIFDVNFEFTPTGDRRTSSHTRRPYSSQSRWPQRQTVEERSLSTYFCSPRQSLGSSEYSTESPVLSSTERNLDANPEFHISNGTGANTEYEESISGWEESKNNSWSELNKRTDTSEVVCFRGNTPEYSSAQNAAQNHLADATLSSPKDSAVGHSEENLLVLIEETNDTQPEVQNILAKVNQQSRTKMSWRSSNQTPRKHATTWKHTLVVKNEFVDAKDVSPPEPAPPKVGKRTGPLEANCRARVKEMRKLGSCLRCRMLKVAVSDRVDFRESSADDQKCTPDKICQPCMKATSSPFTGRVCIRAHLIEYAEVFQPGQYIVILRPCHI